jgi:hypothetical protein
MKHIRHRNVLLEVADAIDQQARIHERFAKVEHADFLDASLAHFARDALKEAKIHIPLRLHLTRTQRAKTTTKIAPR